MLTQLRCCIMYCQAQTIGSFACLRVTKNYMPHFIWGRWLVYKIRGNKSCVRVWLVNIYRQQSVLCEYCRGCLKETPQMVSEQFRMKAGSKCTNWKGIVFNVTERSWQQTSSRRIEKLTWYKNEFFVQNIFDFSTQGKFLCIRLLFLLEWLYMLRLR